MSKGFVLSEMNNYLILFEYTNQENINDLLLIHKLYKPERFNNFNNEQVIDRDSVIEILDLQFTSNYTQYYILKEFFYPGIIIAILPLIEESEDIKPVNVLGIIKYQFFSKEQENIKKKISVRRETGWRSIGESPLQ